MTLALDNVAKLTLAPILVTQALGAKRRAQALPEPPGPREGQTGSGRPLRLLIIGDSSAAGVGADSQGAALSGQLLAALAPDFRVTWRLLAKTGATTHSTLNALRHVPRAPYDLAVVALGVNDVTAQVPLRRLLAQRARLHSLLQDDFGIGRLVISGLPPVKNFPLLPNPLRWTLGRQSERFDVALADHARRAGHDYIRFNIPFDAALMAVDGFHPGPGAYRLWARELAEHIRQ